MKTQVWLGQNSLRFWYYRYKDSPYYHASVTSIALVVSFFLIINIIIPQTESWFSIRDETIATNQKIAVLQNNSNFITNLDKGLLTSQVKIATSALPAQQDFTAIISSLSQAAIAASVSINDFSFQIASGDSSKGTIPASGVTVVQLVVGISGPVKNIQVFMQTLAHELPISNITQIDFSGQTATITLQFYQKPFPPSSFNPEIPIPPVSDVKLQLLHTLSSWQIPLIQNTPSVPVSSTSGVPLF